jgi:hypothetical protein
MGRIKEPQPAKLFMSLIASDEGVFQKTVQDLRLTFGGIDWVSDRFPFDFTDYYTPEMGKGLFRHFITFERLIPMQGLPEIKWMTNSIEQKYAVPDGKRRINIDPGYLCMEHVLLATTKRYAHRPYLREGIYADLTLIYRDQSFRSLEWTYPDYRQSQIITLFNQIRKVYMEELKERQDLSC